MGTLYLVRHGQASFGADDYDVLSAMGHQQSVRLGEYFQQRGVTFDAALTGTLNRQIQTFAGICQGMGVEFAIPDGAERRLHARPVLLLLVEHLVGFGSVTGRLALEILRGAVDVGGAAALDRERLL